MRRALLLVLSLALLLSACGKKAAPQPIEKEAPKTETGQ